MSLAYRTDLAVEAACLQETALPAGVEQESGEQGNLHIQRVRIVDGQGAKAVGKPIGEYITVTGPPFYEAVETTETEIEQIALQIAEMLPKQGLVLVVGLGNNDITPDAIGPRTIHQILATRHIGGELAEQAGLDGLRAVAALAPGVLGQTGIETSEIIRSVAKQIEPVAVVVVDALAARSTDRLGCTIQIANTGISPGSGVMNARKELSADTLGVPVVSIGIPTVVDASTLAADLLDSRETDIDKRRSLFEPHGQAMMITPREIDLLIGHACRTLSLAINKALQPQLSLEEIGYLVS